MSINAAESTTALDDRLSVAAAIRAHFAAAGMSASQVARETGMSQSKMSRRTTAAEPFDIDELSSIARLFDVTIAELITGTNLPTRARAAGGARGRRGIYLLDDTVGPAGFEPATITVESSHLAPVTDLFAARAG